MFTERVQLLVKSKNVTVAKMLKDLKLGTGTFTTWCSRGTIPSGEILSKIADYFECSVDYLLGRTNTVSIKPAPASSELTEHESQVLEAYRNNVAMQSAVDKLLGIEKGASENIHIVKVAARNGGGIKEVALTDSDIEKIMKLPDINSDDDL